MANMLEQVELYLNDTKVELANINIKVTSRINEHINASITGLVEAGVYDDYVKKPTIKLQSA